LQILVVTCRGAVMLQVHAGAGDHEAALESIFQPDSNSSSEPVPRPMYSSVSSSAARPLSQQLEVADAVLRLAVDNSSTPCIGCV